MSPRPRAPRRALAVIVACVTSAALAGGCGSRPAATSAPTSPGRAGPSATTTAPSAAPTGPSGSGTPPGPTASARGSVPVTGEPTPGSGTAPATATPSPAAARCGDLAAELSLRDQVGQLMMVAISSTGLSASAADAVDASRAGSVLLLGTSTAGTAGVKAVTDAARDAARHPEKVGTLLAADQEGGLVQRLQGDGFDRIPSARRQAGDSPAQLRADATRWGKQLRRAGIDANLAPVADVVPKDLVGINQPIGVLRRGYGSNPTTVARSVTSFVAGMDRAGVATAVKHFPGLGRVRGNTDVTARVVDPTTTRRDRYLKPFAAGVEAGTDMVMVSSAFYREIDPRRRAAYSPMVITTMLREDLGFTGVVISDDLAAVAMQDLAPGQRMLRFLRAGGDLAIVGDPGLARRMADTVVAEARDDDDLAAAIQAATVRVLQLKDRRGLARC